MPLYEYRCPEGHTIEWRRAIEERDAPVFCVYHWTPAPRIASLPQPVIVRPAGYSLKPGDKGYWDFDSKEGRLAPHERRSIAPLAAEELRSVSPPQAVDPSSPVEL